MSIDGQTKSLKAKILIAADGRNSKLREEANIKTVSWDYDQLGIVTTVEHTKPTYEKAIQHFLPSGPFAILPLSQDKSSIVWSEETQNAKKIIELESNEFEAELIKRFGYQLGQVKVIGPVQAFPLNLKIARNFTANRLALVGDSAHGVHPIAGLGFNIAIRDIAALTQIIIEAHRLGLDLGSEVSLEKYARWRRFDTIVSALAMDAINRIFSNDNSSLRVLRDLGLSVVDKMPVLKEFFVQQASGLSGDVPLLLKGEKI